MNESPTPQAAPVAVADDRMRFSIGLPAADNAEQRFPLTPEAAAELIADRCRIVMEADAAKTIHYSDAAYANAGVEISGRTEALGCDIVVTLGVLSVADVEKMRRGATLLTFTTKLIAAGKQVVARLLQRNITAVGLDLIADAHDNHPFADILAEVDGRAAIAVAVAMMANPSLGKGILLGGVPGIMPCETTIIGSSHAARAAARAASGLGSIVRIFDNDTFALRHALHSLGPWAIGSVLHRRTVETAVTAADIIILANAPAGFYSDYKSRMKRGVIFIDITGTTIGESPAKVCDLALTPPCRPSADCVFINPGGSAPRTAAMAISNALLGLFAETGFYVAAVNTLRVNPLLQKAILTFRSRVVNEDVAMFSGIRLTDLSLFLNLS